VLLPDLRPPFEISGDLVAVARRENAAIWAAGKIVKAADILGISDSYLRRRIKDLDIQMP
jgi:hypothetical protein